MKELRALAWARLLFGLMASLMPLTALALPECPGHPSCPPELEPQPPLLYAEFVAQQVPLTMVVGQRYGVSVTLKNAGVRPWLLGEGYQLGSRSPDNNVRWGLNRVDIPHNVLRDDNVTFNFVVTAPAQPGSHRFEWMMIKEAGQWFDWSTQAVNVQVLASNIKGNIDSVDSRMVRGWACSAGVPAAIDVHVYVGGAAGSGGVFATSARADRVSSSQIAAACGTQYLAYGFEIPLTADMVANHAGKAMFVHGISPVGASNLAIGNSGTYKVPANILPVVALTSPSNGSVVGEGRPIALRATASDADDGIASVTFLGDGGTLASTPPPVHAFDWVAAPGNHSIQAVARDTRGAATSTVSRQVHVSKVIGEITAVRDGQIIGWACNTLVAAPIKVRLFAGGAEGAGAVVGDFQANLASSAQANSACGAGTAHAFVATPTAAVLQAHEGKVLHAIGLSSFGSANNALSSGGVHVLSANRVPVVSITSPTQASVLTTASKFMFAVSASDPDGDVARVQLLLDGVVKATLVSMPFQVQLEGLAAGNHTLKAVVRDARGAEGSAQMSVQVKQAPSAGSLTRHYVYDELQLLCKVIEPETGATVFGYDAAGNIAWSASGLALADSSRCDRDAAIASGRRIMRAYDARNRLTQLTMPDGDGSQSWTYAPDGLPLTITTSNDGGTSTVVNSYLYNVHRDLIQESSAVGGATSLVVGYGYDANGSLATQTRPSGMALSFAPNALGQPTRISDGAGVVYARNITWHPSGMVASFQYGNGKEHRTDLNTRQLPKQLRDSGVVALDYQYDPAGNARAILDQQQGTSRDVRMEYDNQDRLISATSVGFGGDGTFRYSYDVHDNLLGVRLGGGRAHSYWYDARNQLTNVLDAAGGTVMGLSWDTQGNLANRNGQRYRFDVGNRLREVVGLERYRYDGYGRRVNAVDDQGQRLRAFYSQSGQVLYEDRRGDGVSEYIYLGGRLLATRRAAGVTWMHVDALGSPVAVTDGSGSVVERRRFEPYGAELGGQVKDGPGYTGHVSDSVTGLSYMQQRYMDPQLGVFLSVDPVTAYEQPVGQFNRYRYASSNPYRFLDPDGRYDCEATKAQCQQIDRAMSKVYAAQGKATGDAKTVLDGVTGFLGKKGDGNGVLIRDTDTNAGSWLGLQRGGILKVNFQALNNLASQLGTGGQDFMIASTLVHEGWHGWWEKLAYAAGIRDPWSRSYSTSDERRAGTTEALLARSLNYNHPQGFWTRGGGFDKGKIKAQAARSVDMMCAASAQGGLPCVD